MDARHFFMLTIDTKSSLHLSDLISLMKPHTLLMDANTVAADAAGIQLNYFQTSVFTF